MHNNQIPADWQHRGQRFFDSTVKMPVTQKVPRLRTHAHGPACNIFGSLDCKQWLRGASTSMFQAPAGAAYMKGIVKSVAGAKTHNPRFTIFFDQIHKSFTELELFVYTQLKFQAFCLKTKGIFCIRGLH